jgi:(1->4)-alpha-D-glucan 1-alpha-D-glucosylmutase
MPPRATYRLQFGKDFGFSDAARIAPYLARLGISHVYASPYLLARPGSKHGYDITDHNKINGELGSDNAFDEMLRAFKQNGLEHILDFVPNHMGVGGADNPLWLAVLEWGRDSECAQWFDVDWDCGSEYLHGKLLVPFLAEQYGAVLESGQIELKFDENKGEFSVWLYGTHKLPVAPSSYPVILNSGEISSGNSSRRSLKELSEQFASIAENKSDRPRLAARLKLEFAQCAASDAEARLVVEMAVESFRGEPGQLTSWKKLDALIREQHWRPTHFRVAADDINYRRFFNISELAGIRMELPEVFEYTHRLVLQLVSEGKLQGLRIDHIDGLYNPKEYLDRLRDAAGPSLYLVVEKILANHETLRDHWPVDGTTGYEFCHQVTGLLVDPAAEQTLTKFYRDFTGESQPFSQIVKECKILIMENEMASELESLSREAVRVARKNPRTTDFTQNILRRALKATVACFPVYRTYVDASERTEADDRYIHWAIAQAVKNEPELDPSVFEFLEKLLNSRLAEGVDDGTTKESVIRFAMRAQQFSGPVMAKGLEDTALYRFNRFVALNEVGSSPDHFGLSLSQFHKENQQRAEKWPNTLLTTSTHDTKRGEDARARLAALSLIPDEWSAKVSGWSRILRARRGDVEGTAPPARNDEYLFFQNLIATWPAELTPPRVLNPDLLTDYSKRLQDAMIKSLREARLRSSWTSPDAAYEGAVTEFIVDALNPERSAAFFENFLPFQQTIARMGVRNSLLQLLLKMTSPGVPDIYQGSELWDLSMADPDNRRPVNFEARRDLLATLETTSAEESPAVLAGLLTDWHDGKIKLAVMKALLRFRNEKYVLFAKGSYKPLLEEQAAGNRVCAYLRSVEDETCIALASLDARVSANDYQGARIGVGAQASVSQWRDVITHRILASSAGTLDLSEVFAILPVALLTPNRNSW